MKNRRTTLWNSARNRAGFLLFVSLLAGGLVPVTSTSASALPFGPEATLQCPDGGFYLVDATGLAYGGGTAQYQDPNGTVFNGGACAGNLTLDASVTRIDEYAFESAPLTGLTIPGTVTAIGNAAFGNTGLTSLGIPDSVVSIGTSAFLGVYLTSLVLGNSLTTIGGSAFRNSALTSLSIPASVTAIGGSAFRDAPLTSLNLYSPAITLGSNSFAATAGSNLRCFYDFGGAAISSAMLTSAVLPDPCVVHTITTLAGPNGTFSTSYSYIDAGTSPTYVIAPAVGFMIDSASVDSTDVTDNLVSVAGQTKSYTFAPVTSDHVFSVNFKMIPAPVTPPVVAAPTPAPTPAPSPAPEPPAEPKPEASPSPMPNETSKPTQPKVSKFSIAFFDGGSASLSKANKTALNKLKSKLANASKILLTGFSAGPTILKSDYWLSMQRALGTKKHLRALLGEKVQIEVACKQLKAVGGKYRAVQIVVWP